MLCILKRFKMGFEIQSYIPGTHEMKNRILSKRCLFFLLSKIYQLLKYYTTFAQKYFSPEFFFLGGGLLPPYSVFYA